MKKKNPRKFRWTKAYRAAAGKDLVVDSSFDFEQRRNRPVKYDRNLVEDTLKTMRLVEEIRQQREAAHWERRMRVSTEIETATAFRDIARNAELYDRVPETQRQLVQRAEEELQQQKQRRYEEIGRLREQKKREEQQEQTN